MAGVASGSEIARLMLQGASEGLARAAHELHEAAKRDVPVGDPAVDPDPNVSLRDAGRVEIEHGGRSARVVFETDYAARIHEQQQMRHPRGGGAKFLEHNLLRMVPRLDGILASEVRSRIKRAR